MWRFSIGGVRVGLVAGPNGFVELRTVDFWREKVRGVAEVEGGGGGGTEGESVELQLRKCQYVCEIRSLGLVGL
jgi:hypothetical protein